MKDDLLTNFKSRCSLQPPVVDISLERLDSCFWRRVLLPGGLVQCCHIQVPLHVVLVMIPPERTLNHSPSFVSAILFEFGWEICPTNSIAIFFAVGRSEIRSPTKYLCANFSHCFFLFSLLLDLWARILPSTRVNSERGNCRRFDSVFSIYSFQFQSVSIWHLQGWSQQIIDRSN